MRYAEYAPVLELRLILSMDTYRWSCFLRSSLFELESHYYDTTNSIRSVTRSFGISLFFCYRTSVDSVETVGQRDDQSRRRFRVNRWNQLDDAFAFPSRVDVPRNDKFCDSRSCIIRRLGGGGGDVGRLYTRAYSRRWERAKSGGWWVKGEIPVGISFGARVNAEVGRAPSLILHCSFVRGIFQRFALRSSRRNTPTDPVFTRPIVN